MSKSKAFLVTGSMGCIGAWTLYHLWGGGRLLLALTSVKNATV